MSTPQNPNFNPNTSRLATDRFDFQSHVDGANFRHKAGQIDLSPIINVNGTPVGNVQSALTALSALVPPVLPDATSISKGVIQLSGDIGGSSTSIRVQQLNGYPVSSVPPTLNNVLAWNGSNWTPTTPFSFTASGDLTGNSSHQEVISATGGISNTFSISCPFVTFTGENQSPIIAHEDNTIGENGNLLTIQAQNNTVSSFTGGSVLISSGAGSSAVDGSVSLTINALSGIGTMVHLVPVSTSQKVLSLVSGSMIGSTQMPSNTGNMVMYIANTSTPPTTGSPVGGCIFYSNSGQLWVKQPDGNNFTVGSTPNPNIWGPSGSQVYTSRNTATSTTNAAINAFTFALPDLTSTYVNVVAVGKQSGSNNAANYTLLMGWTRNGGSPANLGTTTTFDSRTTAGASGWSAPVIVISGNNLVIQTGFNSATTIDWTIITTLTMSS